MWNVSLFCHFAILSHCLTSLFGNHLADDYVEEIVEFARSNGVRYVNVVSRAGEARNDPGPGPGEETLPAEMNLIQRLVRDPAFNVRQIPRAGLKKRLKFYMDFNVFLFDFRDNSSLSSALFQDIALTRTHSSLLVFPRAPSQPELDGFFQAVADERRNSYFYYVQPETSPMNGYAWNLVITVNNQSQVVVNKLKFAPIRMSDSQSLDRHIMEDYDLQGLEIVSSSLEWSPYLMFRNCDMNETNTRCDSTGWLMDYTDMIARMFNFSYVSLQDPDLFWGVRPISGPFNSSGVWGGVMGDVINGKTAFSLSEWIWNIERYGLMDFVSISSNRLMLVLTPQPPEIDVGLFIRPFTDDSWWAIGIATTIILICLLGPYLSSNIYLEDKTGHRLAVITTSYFFVLLNAYYGGALTMFFTSEVTIPFESIKDVMRAYPDYKLLMMAGNDVHFQYKAVQGDPDYAAFWERIVNKPGETKVANVGAGLQRLREGRNVLHVFDGMLRGFFRMNAFFNQELKVFAKQKPQYNTLIFNLNSPLKSVFSLGALRLREGGADQRARTVWEGQEIKSSSQVDKMILSPGQTVLVYLIMVTAVVLALALLCLEKSWDTWFKSKPPKDEWRRRALKLAQRKRKWRSC